LEKNSELNERISSLNVELLEHLTSVLKWIIHNSETEKRVPPNMEALFHLLKRSQAIIKEMAEAKYNPITVDAIIRPKTSDEKYHPNDSDGEVPLPTLECFIIVSYWR